MLIQGIKRRDSIPDNIGHFYHSKSLIAFYCKVFGDDPTNKNGSLFFNHIERIVMTMIQKILGFWVVVLGCQSVFAADYRVEITNATYRIDFTPRIVIAHVPVSFFAAGDNLNDTTGGLLGGQINNALTEIAEAGNLDPMTAILDQESIAGFVSYTIGADLLAAGQNKRWSC